MRILFVGDVHATPEELDDCRALIGLIREVATSRAVDRIVFLGDVYHHHNVIRAEVLAFWHWAFDDLLAWSPWVMVGNHDYAGEGSPIHALLAHDQVVRVIDGPFVDRGVLYMPYYADRDEFIAAARASSTSVLCCHQTFEGSKYENGLYAPDGIDQDLVPQARIISGHIHTPQSFGKVTYLGAPRWRTRDDANIDRAIWIYDFNDLVPGEVVSTESFDTSVACRQIRSATDTPESPVALPLDPRVDWRIDIRGSAAWVEERRPKIAGPGVRVRTFATSAVVPKVRESEGVDRAFLGFLGTFEPRFGTSRERLRELAGERLHV